MDFKVEVPDEVVAVLAVLGFVTFIAAILAWGVGDSQKRGQTGCLFLILFVFFGPLAVLVWPEHKAYITECQKRIKEKQSPG